MDYYLQELSCGGRRTLGEGQDQGMVLIGDVGLASAEKELGWGGVGGTDRVRQRAPCSPLCQSAVPPKVCGMSRWPVCLGVSATFPGERQVLSDLVWD